MQYSKKSEGLLCFKTGGTKVQYLNPVPLNILWYYQPCYLLWNFLKCNCYLFWCSLFLSILLLYNWDISTYLLFVENKCFHKNFPIYYDKPLQNRPLNLSKNIKHHEFEFTSKCKKIQIVDHFRGYPLSINYLDRILRIFDPSHLVDKFTT